MGLSEIELRDLCKKNIESFELWSRRLINEKMIELYGPNYLYNRLEDGNSFIKKELVNDIKKRMKDNPKRYPRDIDAILYRRHKLFFM